MLRLGRMTDYGVVVMGHMARHRGRLQSTTDVVLGTGLPVPTVSKVLHRLADIDLLTAVRGRNGGYRMDRSPEDITVARMIEAFEGPVALTDCLHTEGAACEIEDRCFVGGRWTAVARAVQGVLESMTLADILGDSNVHAGFGYGGGHGADRADVAGQADRG
jgi:FeS assembly SUF system regulator